MDAQFWIYIIIGALYFISKMLKKPEQEAGGAPADENRESRRQGRTEHTAERPRPLTFEELLREITEGKQARRPDPEPVAEVQPEPRLERYERDAGEEARSLERVDFDEAEDARVLQKYQEAQSLANERKSLEESLRLEDTVVDFKRFAAFERKQKRNVLQDYARIIRDPERLKQAVVMHEILKRKF